MEWKDLCHAHVEGREGEKGVSFETNLVHLTRMYNIIRSIINLGNLPFSLSKKQSRKLYI